MCALAVFKPLLACLHVVEEAVVDMLLLRGRGHALTTHGAVRSSARNAGGLCGDGIAGRG